MRYEPPHGTRYRFCDHIWYVQPHGTRCRFCDHIWYVQPQRTMCFTHLSQQTHPCLAVLTGNRLSRLVRMSTRQEKPAKIQKTLPCRRKNGSPGILNVNTAREGELGGRGSVRYGAGKTGGAPIYLWLAIHIFGVTPVIFLKTLLKEEALTKPQASAIFVCLASWWIRRYCSA